MFTCSLRDMLAPVLSDRTIQKYMKEGLLIENKIQDIQLQPNSVDLTLGHTFKTLNANMITYHEMIDTKKEILYQDGVFQNHKYIIYPNEFVLMASNEILNIPNGILSFVQGRSSIARLGIQTEQAGLIDSGFRGTITFEVVNQSKYPIVLYEGMRIAQIYFFKAQKAIHPYGHRNKYNGQMDATGSKIHNDPDMK